MSSAVSPRAHAGSPTAHQVERSDVEKADAISDATPEQKAGAAALVDQGNALFRKRQFKAALEKFSAAYALHRDPRTAFLQGECLRELNRWEEAAERYEELLAHVTAPGDKTRERAIERLQAMEDHLAFVNVRTSTTGAEVTIDGKSVGVAPVRARVGRGRHVVRASAERMVPAEAAIEAIAGNTVQLMLSLAELPRVTRAPEELRTQASGETKTSTLAVAPPLGNADARGMPTWLWVVIGVVAVGAATAATAIIVGGDQPDLEPPTLGRYSTSSWTPL